MKILLINNKICFHSPFKQNVSMEKLNGQKCQLKTYIIIYLITSKN